MELVIFPLWLKRFIGRSSMMETNLKKLDWKIHIGKDWWGTRVWKKTTEVTTLLGFKLISGAERQSGRAGIPARGRFHHVEPFCCAQDARGKRPCAGVRL